MEMIVCTVVLVEREGELFVDGRRECAASKPVLKERRDAGQSMHRISDRCVTMSPLALADSC